MTAEAELRSQLHDRTGQTISLSALYRTFDPAPLRPRGRTLQAGLVAAALSGWARMAARRPHSVVLGLSEDSLYVITAVSRLSGWRLGEEIGRAPRSAVVCSSLDRERDGLVLNIPGLEEAMSLYPRYDTADAREIRRILC